MTGSRRWSALPVMLCAVFLAAFDFNVVTVAIPSIQRGLMTTFSEIQLIVAGYALSFAVLLITGGRLGDVHGLRRLEPDYRGCAYPGITPMAATGDPAWADRRIDLGRTAEQRRFRRPRPQRRY